MAMSRAWTEEKCWEILLAGCWRCLGKLASLDLGALDFLGWVLVGPHEGGPADDGGVW